MSYLTRSQLYEIGFKALGRDVLISEKASIYNPENIEIGDNVRIDDFCILSAGEGGIKIGSHIHIAPYVSMVGAGRIELEDYTQIASKCTILSSTDDFSGLYMIGPCIDEKFRNVSNAPVRLEKYSVLGTGCVVMPGVTIGEKAFIGAMSFVRKDVEGGKLYAGNPLKVIREILQFNVFEEEMTWYRD